MNEEISRYNKTVEVPTVKLTIELDESFFNSMDKAKQRVAKERGYDITYGEYIQEAMQDLVKMVKAMEDEMVQLQYASQLPEVKDNEPIDPKTKEPDEPAAELYGHIISDVDKRTMYH